MRCSPSGITCFGIAVVRMEKPIKIWRNMSARILRRSQSRRRKKKERIKWRKKKGKIVDREARWIYETSFLRRNEETTDELKWDFSRHDSRDFHISKKDRNAAHTPTFHARLWEDAPRRRYRHRRDAPLHADRTADEKRTPDVQRPMLPPRENESTASTWTAAMITRALLRKSFK